MIAGVRPAIIPGQRWGTVLRTINLKLLHTVPVLLIVSFATLALLELVPGDPAVSVLGADARPEDYARVREQLGLEQPLPERYVSWLGSAVTGDLGNSVVHPSRSVWSLIASRLPVTLQIAGMALVMALLISIPVGMFAASRVGSAFDRATAASTSGLISLPPFVAGLLLIYLFVFNPHVPRWLFLAAAVLGAGWLAWYTLRLLRSHDLTRSETTWQVVGVGAMLAVGIGVFLMWPSFPRQGFSRITGDGGIGENLRTAFLPALTVALTEVAVFARLLRSDMISTLQEDYILASRAKGMPVPRILLRDALRPSSFSLITLAGVSLGRLVGGTVIVETIFNLPGMGRLIIQDGVIVNDFPVVQGAVLVIAVVYVALNALVDISYAVLDPRIRRGAA